MNKKQREALKTVTITVPEAGHLLGVGRGSAYKYARRGEIPTIRLGRRLLVLKEPLEKMLKKTQAAT